MSVREICDAIYQSHSIRLKGRSQIIIDSIIVQKNKLREHFLRNKSENPVINDAMFGAESESLFRSVGEELFHLQEEKTRNIVRESIGQENMLEGLEPDEENLLKFRPLKDVLTTEIRMFSLISNRIVDLKYEYWRDALPKDYLDQIKMAPCVARYEPYDLYKSKKGVHYFDDVSPLPVLYVNLHVAPDWRFNRVSEAECPERIMRFLIHLFPDVECREFFLNWVRNAILSRNNTNLVLNSAKGTGKNILVEHGIKNLVGESNYGKAPRGFFSSNFNSILLNKRIILIDEHRIDTPDKQDMVKDYSNPLQNIEQKGKDANHLIETFHSFIILNNRETDIKIEQDDRRYAVMDVTDVRLNEFMSEEEIQELINDFNDPECVHQFGNWILNQCGDERWSTESLYKGEKWRRLIEVSLWEWQKFVLDTILTKEEKEYDIESLKARYKRIRTSNKSNLTKDLVQDFLKNYKHEGTYLGKVEKVNGAWVIVPSQKYLPDWAKSKKKFRVEL